MTSLLVFLYRLALNTYPRSFRERYGADMVAAFREQLRDRAGGKRARAGWVAAWSLFDAVRSGWRERTGRHDPVHGGRRRRRPLRFARPRLGQTLADVRHALRRARRRPALTLAAVVTSGLGLAATTTVFTLVNGILLKPLPLVNEHELVAVQRVRPNGAIGELAWPDLQLIRENADEIAAVGGYSTTTWDLVGGEYPSRIRVARVTRGFFDVLAVRPLIGRMLIPDDHGPDGRTVAVLSHASWTRRFGADPAVVGTTVRLNDRTYTIVGVMGEDMTFPDPEVEAWVPTAENFHAHAWWLSGIARVASPKEMGRLRAQLQVLDRRIAENDVEYADRRLVVFPLRDYLVARTRPQLLILLAAVGLLLLVAVANVANLTLIGVFERRDELRLRGALGASAARLARQIVTESLVVSTIGGVLAIGLTYLSARVLVRISPALPRLHEVGMDIRVFGFAFVTATVAGIVFGLLPAFTLRRDRAAGTTLHAQRHGDRGGSRTRSGLVVAQVTLAVVLVTTAGLLVRSYWLLSHTDPGFAADETVTARVSIPGSAYPDAASVRDLHERLRLGLDETPGVLSVSSVNLEPFGGGNWCNGIIDPPEVVPCAEFRTAGAGYFALLHIPLIAGREFAASDGADAPPVVVVNQTLAQSLWPGETALGRTISMFDSLPRRVVGVVRDVKQFDLRDPVAPELYMPQAQFPLRYVRYVVRTRWGGNEAVRVVRDAIRAVDPMLPVSDVATMRTRVWRSYADSRFRTIVLVATAVMALSLALVGLAGVTTYAVTRRAREIGIRMALGAQRRHVGSGVLRDSLRLIGAGAVLGVLLSWGAARVLEGFLFGVRARDPVSFVAAAAVVIALGVTTSLIPARRATRIDPLEAIRSL